MTEIEPGRLLTEQEAREVNAALTLDGLDQKRLAEREAVSYDRVNRMLRSQEVVTPSYADLFNRVRARLPEYVAEMPAAA